MEPIQRNSEVGPLLYDPYPYWSSPRSTLLSRIYAQITTLQELLLPSSDTVGNDACTGIAHRALEVPEILCLIFRNGLSDRNLVHCALVCRIWGTWALDLLWGTRRVPLHYALQTLTHVTKRTRYYRKMRLPYIEIGRIEEDGWRRFLALSNKITRIAIYYGLSEASLERIKRAKRTFNGEPFGHLRNLQMGLKVGDQYAINLVSVPSLTSIHLFFRNPDDDIMEWVSNSMPAIAPHISHLEIGRGSNTKLDVFRYTALRYLEIRGGFYSHLWESLASCHLLTKIEVTACIGVRWREEWQGEYVYFSALRTLKLRGGHQGGTVGLILRSRMPMLERLWWDSPSSWRYSEDLDRIVAHLRSHSPKIDPARLPIESGGTGDNKDWYAESDDDCC